MGAWLPVAVHRPALAWWADAAGEREGLTGVPALPSPEGTHGAAGGLSVSSTDTLLENDATTRGPSPTVSADAASEAVPRSPARMPASASTRSACDRSPATARDLREIVPIHHADRDLLTVGDDQVKVAVGAATGLKPFALEALADLDRDVRQAVVPGRRARWRRTATPSAASSARLPWRLAGGAGRKGGPSRVLSDADHETT
jgi:hypothetical protein